MVRKPIFRYFQDRESNQFIRGLLLEARCTNFEVRLRRSLRTPLLKFGLDCKLHSRTFRKILEIEAISNLRFLHNQTEEDGLAPEEDRLASEEEDGLASEDERLEREAAAREAEEVHQWEVEDVVELHGLESAALNGQELDQCKVQVNDLRSAQEQLAEITEISKERDESSEEIARMHTLEEKYKAEIAQLAKELDDARSLVNEFRKTEEEHLAEIACISKERDELKEKYEAEAKKSHLCPKCVETEEARLEAEAAAREAEEEAAREEERRAAEEAARLAIQEAGRKAHAAIRAEQERLEAEEAARLQAEAAAIEAEEEAARAEHCRTAEEAARFTTQEAARRAELERLEAEAAEEAARLEAEAAAREAEQVHQREVEDVVELHGLESATLNGQDPRIIVSVGRFAGVQETIKVFEDPKRRPLRIRWFEPINVFEERRFGPHFKDITFKAPSAGGG